jgi:hypothetical protein
VLLLDGFEFCRMAFALRRDGPPPIYPPRNGTFLFAIVRGLVTITIGAMLSHSNRHRLAALANHFGWNHVTLTLNHVQRAPRRVRFRGVEQDAAGGCDAVPSAPTTRPNPAPAPAGTAATWSPSCEGSARVYGLA